MQRNSASSAKSVLIKRQNQFALSTVPNYIEAEQTFITLLEIDNLDENLDQHTRLRTAFEKTVAAALTAAYSDAYNSSAAHRFLHRILYRINRLKFFWYDALEHYTNERSLIFNPSATRLKRHGKPGSLRNWM